MYTQIVVTELLDDATFRDAPVTGGLNDPSQFGLQELQPGDLGVNGGELLGCKVIGLITRPFRLVRET